MIVSGDRYILIRGALFDLGEIRPFHPVVKRRRKLSLPIDLTMEDYLMMMQRSNEHLAAGIATITKKGRTGCERHGTVDTHPSDPTLAPGPRTPTPFWSSRFKVAVLFSITWALFVAWAEGNYLGLW